MKNLIFIICVLFLSICSNAQTVAVSAQKMNTFYVKVSNPITIAVEGVMDENLKVYTDNGKITKMGRGQYNVQPEKIETTNIIVEWNGQKITKSFRTKPIPDPDILINSSLFEGHESSTENCLIPFKGIRAEILNFDFDARCAVVSYTCTCVYRKGDVKQIQVLGHSSDEAERLIAPLQKGDKVFFSNFRVKCSGDTIPRLIYGEISRIIK